MGLLGGHEQRRRLAAVLRFRRMVETVGTVRGVRRGAAARHGHIPHVTISRLLLLVHIALPPCPFRRTDLLPAVRQQHRQQVAPCWLLPTAATPRLLLLISRPLSRCLPLLIRLPAHPASRLLQPLPPVTTTCNPIGLLHTPPLVPPGPSPPPRLPWPLARCPPQQLPHVCVVVHEAEVLRAASR